MGWVKSQHEKGHAYSTCVNAGGQGDAQACVRDELAPPPLPTFTPSKSNEPRGQLCSTGDQETRTWIRTEGLA